ncbi:cardiolipin synthase [Psychromonas sp. RZ22]|uniref:cardiolipin synthase n=1 Tax=Psychromonas algarum TaxID=2555643 RepID=UPI0010679D15|nr:cardiolipin synthase [Psychromonas sp. RZ22]TEW55606.1 cardiolipin synthase [Psychromonas sp. RZ22]
MELLAFYIPWLDSQTFIILSATIYFSLLALVSFRVILNRKQIGVSLAWLFLIFTVPLAGMIGYFIFGELTLGAKRSKQRKLYYGKFLAWVEQQTTPYRQTKENISVNAHSMQAFVESYTHMPMVKGNQHTLLNSADDILLELIKEIKEAKQHCYLMFYICHQGGLVDQVLNALKDAASRGVSCKLLLDSVGSHEFFKSVASIQLRAAGVEVVEALPVGAFRLLFQRQDLRLHRKLVCIDDHIAYTGSMNLVDPAFFKVDKGFGEWIDVMVRCEGPIVQQMLGLFVWDWSLETGEKLNLPSADHSLFGVIGDENAQLIPSGPEFGKVGIHQVLLTAIYEAKYSLVLTTPYFVPDESLLMALQVASMRGVDVKIILPAKNDSIMVEYASRAFFEDLLSSGVEIHQFYGGLLHTKSIVIDEKIALIGTVNLDRRSFWLNFEMTMLIDNENFAGKLLTTQMHYTLVSEQLTLAEWKQRSFSKRLLEGVLYLFSPLL